MPRATPMLQHDDAYASGYMASAARSMFPRARPSAGGPLAPPADAASALQRADAPRHEADEGFLIASAYYGHIPHAWRRRRADITHTPRRRLPAHGADWPPRRAPARLIIEDAAARGEAPISREQMLAHIKARFESLRPRRSAASLSMLSHFYKIVKR